MTHQEKLIARIQKLLALVILKDQALAQWKKDKGIVNAKQSQTRGSSDGQFAGAIRGRNAAFGGAIE